MKKVVFLGILSATFGSSATDNLSTKLIADDPFFKDTKIELGARNYYKYLKEDEGKAKTVHAAWGQAFYVDYKSGYLADLIGIDVRFTDVFKLAASNNFADRGILYNSGPRVGYNKDDAHGFNKFGQRLIKLKLGDENFGFNAKYGWQILHNYGVLAESYRASSNSYYGYTGTLNYDKFKVELGYVTNGMYRDTPDTKKFASKDYGKNLNHIITSALVYKDDDFFFSYNYGSAADYKRMHIIETSYKLTPDVKLGAQIYGSQAIGYYNQMVNKEFDRHAWHYATDIQWTQPDWMLKAGIGYTDAPRKDGIGYYERNIAQNVRGRFEPMSETMQAYVRDGETVVTLMGTYNITEKYKTGFITSYAQLQYKGNTVRTGEINWINFWEPAKDFNVGVMLGYGWGYKHNNRTPILNDNGKYQTAHLLSADFIVDYRFNLL